MSFLKKLSTLHARIVRRMTPAEPSRDDMWTMAISLSSEYDGEASWTDFVEKVSNFPDVFLDSVGAVNKVGASMEGVSEKVFLVGYDACLLSPAFPFEKLSDENKGLLSRCSSIAASRLNAERFAVLSTRASAAGNVAMLSSLWEKRVSLWDEKLSILDLGVSGKTFKEFWLPSLLRKKMSPDEDVWFPKWVKSTFSLGMLDKEEAVKLLLKMTGDSSDMKVALAMSKDELILSVPRNVLVGLANEWSEQNSENALGQACVLSVLSSSRASMNVKGARFV